MLFSGYRSVHSVESRTGTTRGFGLTPGELLTISKTTPSPKSEKKKPARKNCSSPNLWNPFGRFDGASKLPSRRPLPVSPRPPSGIDTTRCWARQCRRTGETPVFCTSVCVCVTRETRLSLVPLDPAVTPVTWSLLRGTASVYSVS